MRIGEIKKLVAGTADPAFALNPNGCISAWNKAAEVLFGVDEKGALGSSCSSILKGIDECGKSCSENCTILKQAKCHVPLKNYEIQIETQTGRQWCNVSVLIIDEATSKDPHTVHIVRVSDIQKRFELLVRDFVVGQTSLSTVNVAEIMASKKAPSSITDLTKREIEILQHLSRGEKTADIANQLFISRTTANNHIQHIMKKLSAHSRLEAVRRAEQAGLI